jgi:toluene monooxygenase system ferredoxin subunit
MGGQVDTDATTKTESWHEVMPLAELWIGEMVGVEADGHKVVVLNVGGEVKAYEDRCPHLSSKLSEGDFDGTTLMCSTHLWEFDCMTGEGINPKKCGLTAFAVQVDDGTIFVGT